MDLSEVQRVEKRGYLLRWMTGIYTGLAVIALSANAIAFYYDLRFIRSAKHTRAEIVRIDSPTDVDRDDEVTYRFTDSFGTCQEKSSTMHGQYRVGDKIDVLFAPDRNHRSELAGFGRQWAFTIACLLMTAVFTLATFGVWRSLRKNGQYLAWLKSQA